MQYNDFSIYNVIFHWVPIETSILKCAIGVRIAQSENEESLWHVEIEEAKENLKNEKWWVGPQLFKMHIKIYEYFPR